MIKYVANSFLATRVSFINEIARLCEQLGVDVDHVVDGVSRDPRIGAHFFRPGIGYGGSCLPKDVAALRYVGETFGVATPVLSSVQEVNQAQRTSAVRKLRRALGTLEGAAIGVWGLTFKGGTEDVRESPAMDVIGLLLNEGANLRLYDPTHPVGLIPDRLAELLVDDPLEAARDCDALAVLTDWPAFRRLPLAPVRSVMRGDVLFDGRNLLDREAAEAAGFRYTGVGRGGGIRLPAPSSEPVPLAVS
jgi:UDPglucose 6-dehydrogenase